MSKKKKVKKVYNKTVKVLGTASLIGIGVKTVFTINDIVNNKFG